MSTALRRKLLADQERKAWSQLFCAPAAATATAQAAGPGIVGCAVHEGTACEREPCVI